MPNAFNSGTDFAKFWNNSEKYCEFSGSGEIIFTQTCQSIVLIFQLNFWHVHIFCIPHCTISEPNQTTFLHDTVSHNC